MVKMRGTGRKVGARRGRREWPTSAPEKRRAPPGVKCKKPKQEGCRHGRIESSDLGGKADRKTKAKPTKAKNRGGERLVKSAEASLTRLGHLE